MITLPWLFAAIIFLIDQWIMTRLVRRQYEEHRAVWETDGQPRPLFWIPPETVLGGWYLTYRSGRSFQIVTWRWLFVTPEWIRQSKDSSSLLFAHRVLLLVAILCIVAPFIAAALLQRW